jgi:hypothetical protein
MKKSTYVAVGISLFLMAVAAFGQTNSQKSFENLKALAGNWEGKASNGAITQVSYKLTANGSAVMSEINGHGEDMISMFHMDGPDRLILTHYCSAGNQPRLQAFASPDGKTVTFNFFDGTNLTNPDIGHMQRVVIAMVDANHHTEDWSFDDHGKEMKEFFDLYRK